MDQHFPFSAILTVVPALESELRPAMTVYCQGKSLPGDAETRLGLLIRKRALLEAA